MRPCLTALEYQVLKPKATLFRRNFLHCSVQRSKEKAVLKWGYFAFSLFFFIWQSFQTHLAPYLDILLLNKDLKQFSRSFTWLCFLSSCVIDRLCPFKTLLSLLARYRTCAKFTVRLRGCSALLEHQRWHQKENSLCLMPLVALQKFFRKRLVSWEWL